MKTTFVIAAWFAAGGMTALAFFQNSPSMPGPPPPPANEAVLDDYKISTERNVVLLDVSVKDSKGGFVAGLDRDRFRVYENKVEQPLSIFAAQDVPVTVGLVVDNSGSVRPKKAEIVTAALAFVKASNPKDEVFVVNFNDSVRMGLPENTPFTDDHAMLRSALLSNPAQGRTALYDAIKLALSHLDQGRLDKKTLVLISDGGDNSSEMTRDDITRLAERSLATIYTVGIFNPGDKDKNPGFLKDMAELTGGEAYIPENMSNLIGICEKIARDIRNRYTLGYSPTNTKFDGKKRHLKVLVSGEDGRRFEARTRTHYVAASHSAAR